MITEDAFVDFKCPYCRQDNSFPQEFTGRLQECVNCLQSLIVPEAGSAAGRTIPIPISTPRLRLRRLAAADLKDLVGLFGGEDNAGNRLDPASSDDEKEAIDWLTRIENVKLTTPNEWYFLGIELQSTARIIGHLSMWFPDLERSEAWISILFGKQGCEEDLAVEAIGGILSFCFADLKLHRVVASRDNKDVSTIRWLERAGLRREAEFMKDKKVDGEWHSTVQLAILDEEYCSEGKAPPLVNS